MLTTERQLRRASAALRKDWPVFWALSGCPAVMRSDAPCLDHLPPVVRAARIARHEGAHAVVGYLLGAKVHLVEAREDYEPRCEFTLTERHGDDLAIIAAGSTAERFIHGSGR